MTNWNNRKVRPGAVSARVSDQSDGRRRHLDPGCKLLDVSSTGARIEIEGTTDVLKAKEFFLILSSTGLAFRRCEMVWIDGTTVGIRFLVNNTKPGKKSSRG